MSAPSRPPIFIITHEFYPRRGGIATFAEEMAGGAAQAGLPVEVWAQALPAGQVEKSWPFLVHRLRLKGSHNLICQIRLARQLIRHRRDLRRAIVHLAEPGPMYALMWLQLLHAFRPKRIQMTFHGSEILKFHHNRLMRPLARRLIQHAERISTLTQFTRDLLIQHFPEAAGKTVITPGALRAELTGTTIPSPTPQAKVVILTVGRLHPRKGQLQTLKALQSLPAEQRAQVEYWIAGGEAKQNYDELLRQQAAQSDVTVKFLGNLPDEQLGPIYDQADIFALTSIPHSHSIEGFGLVYLEASAHGLPVVAHAIGGVAEAVSDGETGLLISPAEPDALTAAFARLIADPVLRRRLGDHGRVWARRNNWKSSAEALFNPAANP